MILALDRNIHMIQILNLMSTFLSGVQEEGIYRLSGVKSKVQALLDRFMSGK
jgi:hypothetical protein